MKILIYFVLALTLPFASLALETYTRDVRRTVELKNGGRLELASMKGSVLLEGWDRNEVEVIAQIVAEPGNAAARDAVDATEIEIEHQNGVVFVRTSYQHLAQTADGEPDVTPAVHFRIRAPRRLDLQVIDAKSDLRIRGFDGKIDIAQQKGQLTGENLTGTVAIEKIKGDVDLSGLRGSFAIVSQKGNIALSVVSIDAASHIMAGKGHIELRIPGSLGMNVRARGTGRNSIRSDFALDSVGLLKNSFQGQVNGGGPEVSLTAGGNVRLMRAG